ncbi:MAG: hypothetical protein EBZ55_03555, partial [Actinobacteria bacterium]|nr:hypothetical protein [Actinomycetota bacterium]
MWAASSADTERTDTMRRISATVTRWALSGMSSTDVPQPIRVPVTNPKLHIAWMRCMIDLVVVDWMAAASAFIEASARTSQNPSRV